MSVSADVAFVYGVRFTHERFDSYIRQYTKMSFEEFVDEWYDFVYMLDAFDDTTSDYYVGIKIKIVDAHSPLQDTLDCNDYRQDFEERLSCMFPQMPKEVRESLCQKSGFLADVRWH